MVKHLCILTAVVATTLAAGIASSQTTSQSFLTPLPARFVAPPSTTGFCGQLALVGRRCPPVVVYGGPSSGGPLPTIDPPLKADLPHVRVSMVLQEIANVIVSGGGVSVTGLNPFVEWTTTGAAASVERGGPYGYSLPGPGSTWNNFGPHTILYDALQFNTCESFGAFPIRHDAVIRAAGGPIGAFAGVDNTTVDHTGFYNFSYTVRARDARGGVSDFRFSGKVNATCSGLVALP